MLYYFNNAATSWPKPQQVINTINQSLLKPSINSSRHCNCITKEDDVDIVCKNTIANLFNVDNEKYDITITCGATYSANIVINWLSQKTNQNIYLITDNSNHNSIYRTHYEKINNNPIIVDWDDFIYGYTFDTDKSYYAVITHANNVDGTVIETDTISKILDILRPFNIPVIIDITQSAGTYDIDISKYNYDNLYIICSGHKGLYSTTGIGFLIHPKKSIDIPLISGGTGGFNGIDYQHTNSLEAGTPNELAMHSLIAGINYIKDKMAFTRDKKSMLVNHFIKSYNEFGSNLQHILELVECKNPQSGIVCFKIKNKQKTEEFLQELTKTGFIVRSGVHCSPLYHINILKCDSTVRFSFGCYNTIQSIIQVINYIKKYFNII
jgi:selenocysteine lyase/cysteine desulfurase